MVLLLIIGMLLLVNNPLCSISENNLTKTLKTPNIIPFSYDLGIKIIPSTQADTAVMICCHGYGGSNIIADVFHSFNVTTDHVVSFNFPDYSKLIANEHDAHQSLFGSVEEILPLLYVIKLCIIDAQLSSINLYGFSAGGGAIINMLAVLNRSEYDAHLKKIGITDTYKKMIIAAIEKGHIILNCPLKSIDEIMALHGKTAELTVLRDRYVRHDMCPIDAINYFHGLTLNIILHFQVPDATIGNRDDKLFINRLCNANNGTTTVVLGYDGGHNAFHASLWQQYKEFKINMSAASPSSCAMS